MGRAPHGVPEGGDADLAALLARPFSLVRPPVPRVPFVFASPHSGRRYPASLVARSRLDAVTLRRSEDAYVDELFLPCVALGAPLLRAFFPRAYLDVNREPYELDPQIFDGRLPEFANTRSLRVAVGLGTIPRVVGDAQPIYKKPISIADGLNRIETLYRPYHAQLKALMERARAWFGVAVLLDLHSMPPLGAPGLVPRIVIGDRHGTTAATRFVRRIEAEARGTGFAVTRNAPYAGGHIVERHGDPRRGVHAVQLELDRSLYLDTALEAPGPGFDATVALVRRILFGLTAEALGQPAAMAAE